LVTLFRDGMTRRASLAGPPIDFLAHMSHEIRNPLYGIVGSASLLAKTELNDEQRFYLKTLENSSRALMGMVDEVLDYSKFSKGILEFHSRHFNLRELSDEVLSLYANVAEAKKLRLECAIADGVHEHFFGDPERIRQVLMNLLSNALKYTESGGIHLCWTILEDSSNYQSIRCEVQDTGKGISKEAQASIFKPFFRIDPSLKVPGTGLGLSISKMIIEKMQGKIGLKSAHQKGTTFWFELVLSKSNPLSNLLKEAEKMSLQPSKFYDLSFFKLLVAEDNPVNQTLLTKMLEKMGIQFKLVGDGDAVINTLLEERYDLVLMDCYMAPMNGFETAQKIRGSKESFRNIPLLAFTASSTSEDRQRCTASGMDDILLKPVTFEQLSQKLQQWVEKIYNELPVLDESSIDKIRMFDDAEQTLMTSLFQIYSENTADELRQIKELIEDDDIPAVRKKAHKLKSSAAQLGALRFEKYCNLMEHEPSLNRERAARLHAEMLEEYENSKNKFRLYCQNHGQSPNVLM
jgi:CheY-like chemotaxis protein